VSAFFSRIIVIVLDSVGAGALHDAGAYGDEGSNTLGNIARQIPLRLPMLRSLGLDRIVDIGPAVSAESPQAAIGRMAEASKGKDSVTGHWEMMGIVLDRPFPVFPSGFPKELIDAFEHRIGRGTLGNYAASGTKIIDDLGAEHMRTGKPIVYTSADSVFQIAAHEDVIPIEEQYRINNVAFELVVGGYGVGRVIARPFVGQPGGFSRTANRRDFAMTPTAETVLDRLKAAHLGVVAIGKIEDLFAGRGISRALHTTSDAHAMD
jgi:phosphopentomutase